MIRKMCINSEMYSKYYKDKTFTIDLKVKFEVERLNFFYNVLFT